MLRFFRSGFARFRSKKNAHSSLPENLQLAVDLDSPVQEQHPDNPAHEPEVSLPYRFDYGPWKHDSAPVHSNILPTLDDPDQDVIISLSNSNDALSMSGLGHPNTIPPSEERSQQSSLDRPPSTSSLLISSTPGSRSNSIGSTASRRSKGTTGTGGTGNSDEKSESTDQPDWFETSQIPKYWKTGASILRRIKLVRPSADHGPDSPFIPLIRAIESLSSVTKEMNLNAKAWWEIGTMLSRHVRRLKSSSPSLDSSNPIQEYIKVTKHILALWIHTVDPSIHIPYDMLAPHERPKRFPQDRHELFIFALDYATEAIDEDAVYKQKNRLEDAFRVVVDTISGEITLPPLDSSQPLSITGEDGFGGELEEMLNQIWAAENEDVERGRDSNIGSTSRSPT